METTIREIATGHYIIAEASNDVTIVSIMFFAELQEKLGADGLYDMVLELSSIIESEVDRTPREFFGLSRLIDTSAMIKDQDEERPVITLKDTGLIDKFGGKIYEKSFVRFYDDQGEAWIGRVRFIGDEWMVVYGSDDSIEETKLIKLADVMKSVSLF